MKTRDYIVFLIFFLVALNGMLVSQVSAQSVLISWQAVTQDTSGNPESTPIYYNIYCETFPFFTPDTSNFLAATTDTSYVHTDSRLSDPNIHLYYIVTAVDVWGNESALSERVGEVDFVGAKVKIFLQGAYNAAGDTMTTSLALSGDLPLSSPYSEAPRTVSSIPSGVTDWILVQLRRQPDSSVVSSQSFFLKSNGMIVEPDGSTQDIGLPNVTDDSYYLVLKHRNHLSAMSRDALALTKNATTLYDFTAGSDKFYGTGGAKELENGVWGMFGGNANNENDMINVTDYSVVKSQFAQSGYLQGDVNLSGVVSIPDYSITKSNFAKYSTVP